MQHFEPEANDRDSLLSLKPVTTTAHTSPLTTTAHPSTMRWTTPSTGQEIIDKRLCAIIRARPEEQEDLEALMSAYVEEHISDEGFFTDENMTKLMFDIQRAVKSGK